MFMGTCWSACTHSALHDTVPPLCMQKQSRHKWPFLTAKSEASPKVCPVDHSCCRKSSLFHLGIISCFSYLCIMATACVCVHHHVMFRMSQEDKKQLERMMRYNSFNSQGLFWLVWMVWCNWYRQVKNQLSFTFGGSTGRRCSAQDTCRPLQSK